ncbi:MAG: hypothetical protein Terrestrivirus1_359 [Terrestrivirus sp.]|uniref:Uncharacterized protein n=1 Tax=Terrestrivirus sp. TaxID=2487775 RepID=A0A3G4ZKX4_9VIRU|nr:MAG: hypothetical protein Terrestrivirus1_359 [Terrestrivirus sp.]
MEIVSLTPPIILCGYQNMENIMKINKSLLAMMLMLNDKQNK